MEQKTWRWRRKSSEKIIFANARASLSLDSNMDEDHYKEIGSPRCLINATERLPSNICDCAAKEQIIRKHAKMAELAFAGQQMAEAEATFLKQELDKALKQGEVAEQRLAQLDAALKDCMQEMEALGIEQNGKIHQAFSKATKDFEKMKKKLEGRLVESNKRISNLVAENTSLMKALLCKEKLIDDIDRGKGQLEAEFDMLMSRLDLIEKENTLLKYECGVMEEEIKIRNEEIDHGHRSSLENAKQINRLEAECQQLHSVVKKRLQVNSPKKPSKDTSLLIKRVFDLEEENKALREIVSLSDSELESWRIKCGKMDSRLAEVEGQLRDRELSEHGECQSWLDEVLKVILEEQRVSKRSFGDILQDIKIVTGCNDDMPKLKQENHSNVSGFLPWKEDIILQGSPRNGISIHEGKNVTDASFARDKIRKHFGIERSRSEVQLDVASNHHNTLAQMIKIQSSLQEENRKSKEKLELVTEENSSLKEQLKEAHLSIESLKNEVETLRETKTFIEEQMENQRLTNEDIDTQLTVTKAKLNEIMHKVSSLEVELDDKNNCCEDLEATCLELQLQLEILSRKESPSFDIDQVAKKLKTEMIENLGKQLSALNSPDTILIDKVIYPKTIIADTMIPQRSSLRDRMMAEDQTEDPKVSISQNQLSEKNMQNPPSINNDDKKAMHITATELKLPSSEQVTTLALIVPSKKHSGGFAFIRKLFLRRKKGGNRMSVPMQKNTSAAVGTNDVLIVA